MTIELKDDAIAMKGLCGVEEVEDLLRFVAQHSDLPVDLREAEWIHTALWQVLMVAQARLVGKEDGSFAMAHVLPNLSLNHI